MKVYKTSDYDIYVPSKSRWMRIKEHPAWVIVAIIVLIVRAVTI